jgi:hypothetical protein
MTVTPMFRCKCGAPGTRRELTLNDIPVTSLSACDDCVAQVNATLDRIRPVFDAMIAAGIDRTLANETMTYMIDRMPL